jgi:two-component system nitrogen regulation response regulator GlnG
VLVNRLLVISDDPAQLQAIENLLLNQDLRVTGAASLRLGLVEVATRCPDLVIAVMPLDGESALGTLKSIFELEARLPVIVLTSAGSTDEAITATKAGAFDYFLGPYGERELLRSISQGIEAGRLMRSPVALDQGGISASGEALIGRSKPMQEIYKAIGRVAPTDSTVLIRGESGTGKELVARAIYQHSARNGRPFVVVNSVAIPESLLESEIFGHERGAFTGAVGARIGKVKQADGGTLFLDEIGDIPLSIQAKLLRLLEDRSIEPIGGRGPIPVDVRIIAATNRDLEAAIEEGRFREDLYYRLNVVPIVLPPLRARLDDVPLLCDYFSRRFTTELGIRNLGLTPDASRLLATYHWPGNVRELANAIEQALIFSRGRPIDADDVASLVPSPGAGTDSALAAGNEILRHWVHQSVAFGRSGLLESVVDHMTGRVIHEVLEITGGNRVRAARILGISRPTLLARLKKLGLQ